MAAPVVPWNPPKGGPQQPATKTAGYPRGAMRRLVTTKCQLRRPCGGAQDPGRQPGQRARGVTPRVVTAKCRIGRPCGGARHGAGPCDPRPARVLTATGPQDVRRTPARSVPPGESRTTYGTGGNNQGYKSMKCLVVCLGGLHVVGFTEQVRCSTQKWFRCLDLLPKDRSHQRDLRDGPRGAFRFSVCPGGFKIALSRARGTGYGKRGADESVPRSAPMGGLWHGAGLWPRFRAASKSS